MNTLPSPETLSQQIDDYLLELQAILQKVSAQHPQPPHLALLHSKITHKITHFQNASHLIRFNHHSPSALRQLASHLSAAFTQTVKEAHRLLQLKTSQKGTKKLKQKLDFINEMEGEMNEEWEGQQRDKGKKLLKRIDENTSMLANHVDQGRLKPLAKQCLNKQFLTIRMVAYRMYQRYTNHEHASIQQQLQQLSKEQEELASQAEQLNQFNKSLRSQEKRLIRELNDLKRTNQLVGKRYFISS